MGLFLMCVSNYIHTPIYTIHKNTPTLREKERDRKKKDKEEKKRKRRKA